MIVIDLLKKFPDVFMKNPNSLIGKTMQIVKEQFDSIQNEATKVENWRDIEQAEGAALDLMGKTSGQQRGTATDEVMRVLLKARITRNNSDGTIDDIINALAITLGVPVTEVDVKALWDYGNHNLFPPLYSGEWDIDEQSYIANGYRLNLDENAVANWSDIQNMKWSDL